MAKPDARKTGVSGSLAVPVFAADAGQVIGTLGIGKIEPLRFPGEEEAPSGGPSPAKSPNFSKTNAGCGD